MTKHAGADIFRLVDLCERFNDSDAFARTGIEVTLISDAHIGHHEHRAAVVENELAWVGQQPNRFIILLGDLCETALADSKGDVYAQTLSPQAQVEEVVGTFGRYKDRVLAAVQGNHERRVYIRTGFDPSMLYAHALGCAYEPELMVLGIRFGAKMGSGQSSRGSKNVTFTGVITHGWGGARLLGATLNNLQQLTLAVPNVDFYAAGHTHKPTDAIRRAFFADVPHRQLIERHSLLVSAGSALDWASYARAQGMAPTAMVFPRIHLRVVERGGARRMKAIRLMTEFDAEEAA